MRPRLLIALLCAASFVSGAAAAAALPTSFRDVPKSHTAHKAIMWAAKAGIMTGTREDASIFRPDEAPTRAELAQILQRLEERTIARQTAINHAVSPQMIGQQLGDARNAQRRSDVNTILNAVYQYAIDNNGIFPNAIPAGTAREICQTGATSPSCADLDMLTGSYLVRMPKDPQRKDYLPSTRANPGANYFIVRDKATNRITVSAPGAENGATISVTR